MLFDDAATVLLALAFVVWLIILSFWLYRTSAHYSRLVRTTGKLELKQALEKLLSEHEETELDLKKLESAIENLGKEGQVHFQRMGVVRFNPFSETGGDQSFALALLNKNDSGVVLLSLHSREGTRVYAKPIKNGKSRYELSREEMKAVEEARKGK